MSDVKAKMHPNRLRLELGHTPAGGAYSASPLHYITLHENF